MMRIINIILESLKLPIKEFKTFLLIIILASFNEIISHEFFSLKIGYWSLLFLIINIFITLIVFGLMLNLSSSVVFNKDIELNVKEHFTEAVKEYFITFYYILISCFLNSLFLIPTRFYSRVFEFYDYAVSTDFNSMGLTFYELVHQLPVSMQIDLQHDIQLNFLIILFVLIIFSSFGFIAKMIANSGNFKKAFDLRVIFSIIKKIGFIRYLKFIIAISIVATLLCNTIVLFKLFW